MPSPYDSVAAEYYLDRHQTSRNFDQATVVALKSIAITVPTGLMLEVGCGRGRVGEFLGLPPDRVIQLDNSDTMLNLAHREKSLVRIRHEAETLPFPNAEFGGVAAFLCDPYLGLNFLSEVFRVLRPGGILIGTTPAYRWGQTLRDNMSVDRMTTRFALLDGSIAEVPSAIYRESQLAAMLSRVGFRTDQVSVSTHSLPPGSTPVSPDVTGPARSLGLSDSDLEILCLFTAVR